VRNLLNNLAKKNATNPAVLLYALLFIAAIAYFSTNMLKPGYIIYIDVTEPLNLDNMYERFIYSYNDALGESLTLAEKSRIPIFTFVYGTFKILGVSDDNFIKIKFLSLIALNFIAFAWAINQIFKFLEKDEKITYNAKLVTIAIIVGGLYYGTNFWFANRLMHFHLFFTSVTIPITFALAFKYFFEEKIQLKYLLGLVLFLALFTGTPHTVLFELIIVGSLFLVYLAVSAETKQSKIKKTLYLLPFGILTLLLNAYWILTFLSANTIPDAIPTQTIVIQLTKHADLVNSIRLMGYWLTELDEYFVYTGNWTEVAQTYLAFAPVFIAIAMLYVYRKNLRIVFSLLLILLIGLFLATGSNITNAFYFYLMFDSPVNFIGWVFREYDKMGILIAFVYSVSISLLLYKVLASKKHRLLTGTVIFAILVQQFYFFNYTVNKYYIPQEIPQQFIEVNELLEQDTDYFNVMWYPGVTLPVWSSTKEVRFKFSNLISSKPILTNRSDLIYLAESLLAIENVKDVDIAKSLDLYGIKYLVIRTDDQIFTSKDVRGVLDSKTGLEKIYQKTFLTVYKNTEYTNNVKTIDTKLVTNYGLEVFEYLDELNFNPATAVIEFTDTPTRLHTNNTYYLLKGPNPHIDVLINEHIDGFIFPWDYTNLAEDGKPDAWKKTSLEDLNHAASSVFFSNMGLKIKQLDYKKGVVVAREGWQRIKGAREQQENALNLSFSNHSNVSLDKDGNLGYLVKDGDFRFHWNIIRSDKFDVQNIKALEISLTQDIDDNLIPHYKIYTYDEDFEFMSVQFIYADSKNNANTIVKIPEGAVYADFSIWTLSTPKKLYSYNLQKLRVKDISESVEPLRLSFASETKNNCTSNCAVLARVLKSSRGGEIEVRLDENLFYLGTKTGSKEHYAWEYLGIAPRLEEFSDVSIQNINGFNSVNAIVVIAQGDYESMGARFDEFIFSEDPNTNYVNNAQNLNYPRLTKVNPSKYEVNFNNNKGTILTFPKPYSTNWVLGETGNQAKIANGFINAWEIDQTDFVNNNNTLTIKHSPQTYFEIGGMISIVTAAVTSLIVLVWYLIRRFNR
jgi:hypothetical protein